MTAFHPDTTLPTVMQPIECDVLLEAGYCRSAQALFVRFRTGGVYAYFGVPAELWAELRGLAQVGRAMRWKVFEYFAPVRISN